VSVLPVRHGLLIVEDATGHPQLSAKEQSENDADVSSQFIHDMQNKLYRTSVNVPVHESWQVLVPCPLRRRLSTRPPMLLACLPYS